MTKFLPKLISRNRISRIGLFGCALALAVLATAALPERANAQAAIFTSSKILCSGTPGTDPNTDPNTCQPAQIVGSNVPVFYVIKVTNPYGQPAQAITLNETFPGGPGVFNVGTVSCTDQAGGAVGVTAVGQVYSFTLPPSLAPPSWTVICTITGTFSSSANGTPQQNSVVVSNGHGGWIMTDGPVNTFVAAITPLQTDLSVTKSASPTSVGVGTSNPLPATVTYTITVTNNGPTAVDVGPWFVLHDTLALLPGSVALQATFVSATCTSSGGAQCLDGPQTTHSGLIMTAAPQSPSLLDWGYAPGTPGTPGTFPVNGSITVTITVQISAIPGLSCVKALNSDGLNNQAFFTLTNQTTVAGVTTGTALSDNLPANDTSALVPVTVITGNTTVDPNCGDGQLTVTKTQVSPTNPVAWGATVTYDITITNTSIPPQSITINTGALTDNVGEGAGTPPFTRTFISASCTSTSASICSGFVGAPQPPFTYTYYGQSNLGWSSGNQLVLNPNDSVTIQITFQYSNPDCETVPNANPKPIFNVASVTYMATPVGGPPPQGQSFTQFATAQTDMQPQPPCKFVVTKSLSPNQNVQFGVPLDYSVTFTNNGASRNVGTVLDSVRITNPAYATQVPFTVSWTCSTSTGVTGFTAAGTGAGQAIYTSLPPQGAPIFQFTNLYFPQNSTLTCSVTITVQQPTPPPNPNCSTLPAYFENLGLMDVTNPYNPNVTWPPSSTYAAGAASNPPPQNTNWATVDSLLPKCYNVIINKTASVNGVTPAWTWVGGPAVNYTITVTNTGTSGTLTGSGTLNNWNGLLVTDNIVPPPAGNPYAGNNVSLGNSFSGAPGCPAASGSPPPLTWCSPLLPSPPSPSPSYAGVLSLAAGSSGVWNLTLNPPFKAGTIINNCATVTPQGTFTGPDWYPNYDPTSPPTNPPTACASVPVLTTATLDVTKKLVNETGHSLTFPATAFGINVTCQTYPLQSSGNLTLTAGPATNLPNGGSVSSPTALVQNVPVASGETCTVTEPVLPAVPVAAVRACGGYAYWDSSPAYAPTQTIPISATGPNAVTVINTLRCNPTLSVIKTFVDATGSPIPIQPPAFNVQVACNPNPIPPTNLPLTPPATATSSNSPPAQGLVQNLPVVAGETCTVSEPVLPAIPATAQRICGNTAYWDSSPAFTPSATIPITAAGPNVVTVTNTLRCNKVGSLVVKKLVVSHVYGTQFPSLNYTVNVTCGGTTTTLTLTNGGSQTVSNIPYGTSCSVAEFPLPTVPPQMCPSGTSGLWTIGYVPPQPAPPIVINGVTTTVTVTNTFNCVPDQGGSLIVKKVVVSPGAIAVPPATYPANVTCGGTTATLNLASDGTPQTVSNIPYGTNCSVVEPTPPVPPNACPPNTTGTWAIITAPTSIPPISATTTTVTVTNTLTCTPGGGGQLDSLVVNKTVINNTNGAVSTAGLSYPVTATCGGVPTPLTLTESSPGTVGNLALGTNCSVQEGAYPTVSCPQDYLPSWSTVYLPSASVGVNGLATPVTVQNTLVCKLISKVRVAKVVVNNTPNPADVSGLSYPMNVSCVTGTMPPTTMPVSLAGGSSLVLPNIPSGSVCTVSETLPPAPTTGCPAGSVPTWVTPPTYAPPSVTTGSGLPVLTVTNTLTCTPGGGQVGSLIVTKEVVYAGSIVLPSHIYPVTVTCGSTITHLNLVNGVPQTVSNIPLNTSCSVVEVALLPPPNICPPHTTPLWTTAYAPPSPIHITGMGIAELVKNTLTCSPMQPNVCPPPQVANVDGICVCPLPMVQGAVAGTCMCPRGTELVNGNCVTPAKICAPPLVLNIDGVCGCPPGTVLRGKECVRPIDCRAPLIPNAAGTECDCGRGLVLRGGKCVAPIVCKAPATLNSAGTGCMCPKGMVGKGTTCVEPEHNIPGGIPGLGGRGGEGAGPRGGGEGSSPGRH